MFFIELFVNMTYLKEFIHYWIQDHVEKEERNKIVDDLEVLKQNVGFEKK